MKKHLLTLILTAMFFTAAQAQVAIKPAGSGTTADPSAMLDVQSTNKGALLPRMTATQRLAINGGNPATGLMVYDTDSSAFMLKNASGWVKLQSTNDVLWKKNGNDIYNTNSGRAGIGTSNPFAKLEVASSSNPTTPQIKLTESVANNYTRLTMANTTVPNYWTIATLNTGNVNTDEFNIFHSGLGNIVKISGKQSVAFGTYSTADSSYATAMGSSTARNDMATAMGYSTADGYSSTAMGRSYAKNYYATAMGASSADGENATALGRSYATMANATAMGNSTAKGNSATAMGTSTADTSYSTAMGNSNAKGTYSVAGGFSSAYGNASTALGWSGAFGYASTGLGYSRADSAYSTASGQSTASGNSSTAMGQSTANGNVATAFGGSVAKGDYSVAGGYSSAYGYTSTALGYSGAYGYISTALGYSAAKGDYSVAMGDYCVSKSKSSIAAGSYNDTTDAPNPTTAASTDRIFQIGNGTDNATRSNAVTVLRNGNVGVGVLNPKVDFHIAEGKTVLFGADTIGSGSKMVWFGDKSAFRAGYLYGYYGGAGNWNSENVGRFSFATGYDTRASGDGSSAMGSYCWATGNSSLAAGYSAWAKGSYSFALGTYIRTKSVYGVAVGYLNDTTDNPNPDVADTTDRIFQIGNGSFNNSTYNYSNAVTVLRNGNMGIGNINTPIQKLEVAGAIKLSDTATANIATNGTIRYNATQGFQGKHNNNWQNLGGGGNSQWTTYGNDIYNNNSGNVGIGTNNPSAKQEIACASNYLYTQLKLTDTAQNNFTRLTLDNTHSANYWTIAGLNTDTAKNDKLNFFHSTGGDIMQIRGDGRVGIGTQNPKVDLHIAAGKTVLFGADTVGEGSKMMWLPSKGAFRAGYTNENFWNDNNIGPSSFAAGYDTRASGEASTAFGNNSYAKGANSTALGNNSLAQGFASTSMGSSTARGNLSVSTGYGTIAKAFGSLSTGYLNDTTDNPNPNDIASTDRVFQIGNGYYTYTYPSTYNYYYSNALTVLRNGNIGIGNINTPTQKLEVNGAVKLADTTASITATNGTIRYNATQGFQGKHGNNWQNLGGGIADNSFTTNGNNTYQSNIDSGTVSLGANAGLPTTKLSITGNTKNPNGLYVSPGTGGAAILTQGAVAINTITPWAGAALDVNGRVIIRGGSPANGKVLTSDNDGFATWQTPTTYSAGSGVNISGSNVISTVPQTLSVQGNQLSILNGNTVTLPSTSSNYVGGAGIVVAGTSINALHTSAIWNANKLQDNPISATTPTTGQVLTFDGTNWAPTTPTTSGGGSGSSQWTTNGNDINNNNTGKVLMGDAPFNTNSSAARFQFRDINNGGGLQKTVTSIINTSSPYTFALNVADSGTSGGPAGCSGCQGNAAIKAFSQQGDALYATSNSRGVYVKAGSSFYPAMKIENNSGVTTSLEMDGQIKINGGTPGAGKVLTSDANGLATWQTATGGGSADWGLTGNTGNTSANFIGNTDAVDFIFKTNNIEDARFTSGGALLVTGSTSTGTTPTSGAGTRMMWIPNRAAFRAGTINGTHWNDINIGTNSAAFGQNCIASGFNSFASGTSTSAGGNSAVAFGNTASASSANTVALGYNVSASQSGSFCFGDQEFSNTLSASTSNEMSMRFKGGYRLFTTSASTGGSAIAAVLGTGQNMWSQISDVRRKENFVPVNGEDFLKKIATFNLTSWNYKGQNAETFRHYGPMAQDFYKAFGKDKYGAIGNDTSINIGDFAGINFIAIQALEKRTTDLNNINQKLQQENKTLQESLDKVKAEMATQKEEMMKRLDMLEKLMSNQNTTTKK